MIRRQVLDVAMSGTEADGLAFQRQLPELCQNWLLPSLERVFDRLVPEDAYWTIDLIEVDVGSLRPDVFQRDFIAAVRQEVERYLTVHAPTIESRRVSAGETRSGDEPGIGVRSRGQAVREAFLYFLHTGVLPWWLQLPPGATLEETIRATWGTGERDGLLAGFAADLAEAVETARVRARLVRQFSPAFLQALLAALEPGAATAILAVLEALSGSGVGGDLAASMADQCWQTALLEAARGRHLTPDALIEASFREMPPEASWPHALPPRFMEAWRQARDPVDIDRSTTVGGERRPEIRTSRTPPVLDLDEGVFVNAAGVVLLHPFLPRLFEALGIVRDGAMLQPERALGLLYFLATGQRSAPEYDLLLPKLLCGLQPDVVVPVSPDVTSVEVEEAAALLTAAIRHWDALGDTSIDGLRGTFLVRPGRLSRRGDDDVLQVEAKSVDILLDRLPWGVGMIQLPWMKRLLWVEWRF